MLVVVINLRHKDTKNREQNKTNSLVFCKNINILFTTMNIEQFSHFSQDLTFEIVNCLIINDLDG